MYLKNENMEEKELTTEEQTNISLVPFNITDYT